ncbi:MAG: ribokinase, partial [Clostridia bacterium]|nr:ribokinase [Clostridia bacterium]
MKHIYLLGSLNCDLTIRAPYIPERGETLKGSDFMITAGGKGANQAYACANLGGSVSMAGAVGQDAFGDLLLNSLKSAGAEISRIRRTEKNTGVAVITVVDGDNRIILDEGANGTVTEEDVRVLLSDARSGDLFITQLETPLPIVKYALKYAKEKGLYTVFNPAPAKAEARGAVQYADLITPNRKELKLLSGKEGLEEGCEELLAAGAGGVIVTLGEKGSLIYTKEIRQTVPCVNAGEAVDTT